MKSNRLVVLCLGALATLSLAGPASALGTHVYTVPMSGIQEFPPVATSGTGVCTVTLDDVTGSVTVSGSYSNLSGTAVAAHIHGPAPAGVNAGIVVGLTPSGGTAGTVTGGGTLSPANITNLLNGLMYVNVHSTTHGGGEIRGQILAGVPALPWTALVALVGLAAAGGAFVLSRRASAA